MAKPIDCSFFRAVCKGSAFQVFQAVLQAQPAITYAQMCQELSARFNPPQQSQLHEAEFRARKKLATETQVQLAADLQRIAARAFPGQQGTPLFERLLLNRFIDGQGSPELRLHIRSAAPADLDAGVRQALEMSAILEVEKVSPSPPTAAAFATSTTTTAGTPTDMLLLSLLTKLSDQLDALSISSRQPTPLTRSPQPPPAHQFPARQGRPSMPPASVPAPGVCWRCGSSGHYRRDCPQSGRPSQQSKN